MTLKLEAVLDELSNGVDGALAQVCSLVNDPAGNALHASHGRLRSTTATAAALARCSFPLRGFASAAFALGRGLPSAAAR